MVILLLAIHLFNAGGYLLLQEYQVYQTDKKMNDLISQNLYNPNTLVELKIPQHMGGMPETNDYKNIYGQVQLRNNCYNYVKMKITRDTLYLMVIQNYKKTKLIKSNIVYAKQINDIPQDDKDQTNAAKKSGTDIKYNHPTPDFCFESYASFLSHKKIVVNKDHHQPYLPVAGQPPEFLA